ncbi:MAG: ROK family protein [Planctomycetota bacterium]
MVADLGGTKCRIGVVDQGMAVRDARSVATQRSREPFLAQLETELLRSRDTAVAAGLEPVAVGIGVAAVVRPDGNSLEGAPNLPLHDFALRPYLQQRLGLPATLINDGRASALGEYLRGAAAGRDPLLVLFFGTGIGIGLVVGGEPYAGAVNAAGEVGHAPWRPGGRECACGRRGCFEAYCGGGPLCRYAVESIGPPPSGSTWTVGDLVAASDREPRAAELLDEARTAASAMVAGLCTVLNPAAVVLGGGVLSGWPALADEIETFVRGWCPAGTVRDLEFVRSEGGADAILRGAARAAESARQRGA